LSVKKRPLLNHNIPNHKREQKKTKVGNSKRQRSSENQSLNGNVAISINIQYQPISLNIFTLPCYPFAAYFKKVLYGTIIFRTTKGNKRKQKPETANGKGVLKSGH
jgi:hypothetical protein